MNILSTVLLSATLVVPFTGQGQQLFPGKDHFCDTAAGAVTVTALHSDSTCSTFLICIPKRVPLHLHRIHTEHVFVLDGAGEMRVGDEWQHVNSGDVFLIPAGTPHAVEVTGPSPLRVISVQSPFFDGSDRVLLTD